jgi:hypothetical protein
MTNRYPLIINSISQIIEELPAGDNLDLTSSNIVNAGSVQATSLNVTGNVALSGANVALGAVGNLEITGGTNGYVLQTDGTGNLSWVAQSGGGGTPGGSNTFVQFNDAGSFGGTANLTFDKTTSNLALSGNLSTTYMSVGGGGILSIGTGSFNGSLGAFRLNMNSYANARVVGDLIPNSISVGNIGNSTVSWSGGYFSNITTTGTVTLGAVGNVIITGGTNGYVLSTNGSGNLSWVAQSGGGGGSSGYEQIFLMMGA